MVKTEALSGDKKTLIPYLLTRRNPCKFKTGYDFHSAFAQDATKLPPGHPEGLYDAMGNIYNGVAKAIRGEEFTHGAFPDMEEGVRGMLFIEKVLESHQNGNVWVNYKNKKIENN